MKVGVIGCGDICGIYFSNMGKYKPLDVVACADIDSGKAKAAAEKHDIAKVLSPADLIRDPDVEIVVNLTIPKAHATINNEALNAGKHVYTEKPLAISRELGEETIELAREKGLLVGSAPDTVLGAGIQTCRKLIEDGAIGRPVGANAFMLGGGPERWHPNPEFFYKPGGGPLFDMGPYYLSAFIHLFGPITHVTSVAKTTHLRRTVTGGPKLGEVIDVETPTHIIGLLEFADGAAAQLTTSFDVAAGSRLPCIEVYGSEGSLSVPDPNTFGGKIEIKRVDGSEWVEVEHAFGFAENSRGLGVMDMAYAIRTGRPHRASGEFAYHVLDVMSTILEASASGRRMEPSSTLSKPVPMPQQSPADDLPD